MNAGRKSTERVLQRFDGDRLMTPAEVAAAFRVGTKTVVRWSDLGLLTPIWTLGGHRRFRAAEVSALLSRMTQPRSDAD